MMKIRKIGNNGFTLIEVIASLVIMGIVAVIAAMGLVRGVQAYVTTRTSSDTIQRAEYALNRMKLEFMNMDSVTAAGADTISFTSDGTYNPARPTERPLGTVYTFTRAGNQINLTVGAAANPLITGLGTYGTGLLTYLNNTGGVWTLGQGFNTLHTITIQLIIARSDGGGDLPFSTSINPRNNGLANGPQAVSIGQ
jgi:prepilin-type N-terminal cleavage/methylation domain-containing protein